MNTNGRTIPETQKNIIENNCLSYNNLLALLDAFIYDTAPSMNALIKTLKIMHKHILDGNPICYTDNNNIEKNIHENNFSEFVINNFDEFVLNEVIHSNKYEW